VEQLALFPRLSANVDAALHPIEGLNLPAKAGAALADQERQHQEMLDLMRAM
jgi:hypothetical protein